MSDRATPLQVGDQTYELMFDFNAICDVEEETGFNLLAGAIQNLGRSSAIEFRALLYAVLKAHHPEMTLAKAGAVITGVNDLPQVIIGLGKAYALIADDGSVTVDKVE